MKNTYIILYLLTLSSLLFNCSRSKIRPFTNDTMAYYEGNNYPVNELQFYINSSVYLILAEDSENIKFKDGKVKVETFRNREIIRIADNTRGEFVRKDGNILYIKFEQGGTEKEIKFALHGNNNVREYRLLIENKNGTINYDGNTYKIRIDKKNPSLSFKEQNSYKTVRKYRTVKGIKVGS